MNLQDLRLLVAISRFLDQTEAYLSALEGLPTSVTQDGNQLLIDSQLLAKRINDEIRHRVDEIPDSVTAQTITYRDQTGTVLLTHYPKSVSFRINSQQLALTRSEYKLLAALVAKPGEVWTREDLSEAIWGCPTGEGRVIDVHVRRLRQKLIHKIIQTSRGFGYSCNLVIDTDNTNNGSARSELKPPATASSP